MTTEDKVPDPWNSGIATVASSRAGASTLDPASEVLRELAQEALIEKRRSRRWSIFFRLLFCALVLLALLAWWMSLSPLRSVSQKHTAVVEIDGVIAAGMPASADNIIDSLTAALKEASSVGVLLRINSPGGSPVQSGIVFDEILRLRVEYPDKPIHAVVTDVCASGGYYIAAAADRIYADRASIVGSIGVRMDSFGFTGAMQKLGVERRLLTAGENKAMLDPFLPTDEKQQAHVQGLINDIHQQFITAVKKGRGERLQSSDELFSGLFWSGEQALELGLIDELANEREVAADVLGAARRVDYTRREGFAEKLMGQLSLELSSRLTMLFDDPVVQVR